MKTAEYLSNSKMYGRKLTQFLLPDQIDLLAVSVNQFATQAVQARCKEIKEWVEFEILKDEYYFNDDALYVFDGLLTFINSPSTPQEPIVTIREVEEWIDKFKFEYHDSKLIERELRSFLKSKNNSHE
jgi:hypothetical protein